MSKQEIELLQRALDRQVKARKEAEKILESKSKELYDTLHYLREDNNMLKGLLQEKTSELEGVFFNIPDPYLVINLKGQVIKMNQAAKLFLGFDTEKEDFYAAQLVHHEYLMATLQSFGLLQEVGILKNFKTKINIKSGGSRFVQVNANLIYDASGMPIAAQGVLRDVTNEEEVSAILEEQKEALKDSQKRLEAVISDLQAQKEKYSSIIANMNLGLVEVDNEDLVQLVNKSFCTLSGYTEKELYGNKLGQLLHVSDPKIILVHQKNRLKGISDTYEVNVQVKGGQKKHWLISGAPRYNEKGQVIVSIGIHLDITEQY